MKRPRAAHLFSALLTVTLPANAVPLLIDFSTPYTQDFNTLANSGTSSVLPDGWAFFENGVPGTAYTAGTGSSTTGDTYSFGSAGSSERALGGLQTGSLIPLSGLQIQNGTGSIINAVKLDYFGEQWRLGALSRLDKLDFQYSLDATSLTTGTWNDFDALDFAAPTTGPTVGALDGNTTGNRSALSATIAGLNLADGAVIWFRWQDFNASGADDGLAIDDFSVQAIPPTAEGVPESLPGPFSAGCLLGVTALFGWRARRTTVFAPV